MAARVIGSGIQAGEGVPHGTEYRLQSAADSDNSSLLRPLNQNNDSILDSHSNVTIL